MLISQRIAKDVNFLKSYSGDKIDCFNLRMKIIKAIKVLVDESLFENETLTHEWIAAIKDTNDNKNSNITNKFKDKISKHLFYAKAPFEFTFIECNKYAFLIERISTDDWISTYIGRNENGAKGAVFPVRFKCSLNNEQKIKHDINGFIADSQEYLTRINLFSDIFSILTIEILLYLNTSNIILHDYVPTKNENLIVPKPLIPFYSYKILDIFREKKKFVNLKEVTDFLLKSKEESTQRRSHLVKGHFKVTKNGLFWWNPFTRCRKNFESKGFVDKDYRLN